MPRVVNFKKDSVLFFAGENHEHTVYLLKEGTLVRTKTSPLTARPERTQVSIGEFFGIKASLGNFPRDETVQATTDCTVYIFTPTEFITITKNNLKLLFKMLTALSNELRKIHVSLENKLGTQSQSNEEKLLAIAHYYSAQKKYTYALYAFRKYLELYPNATNKTTVNEHIAELEQITQSSS